MAEVLATAYIQLMPSLRGAQAQIQKEIQGSIAAPVAAESKAAAQALSTNIATTVERDTAPRISRALTQATAKASTGFVAQLKTAVDHFGGTAAVVTGLGQQASTATQRLSGLVRGSSELSTVTGGLKAGLGATAALLGGPWGIAIAGAGLAINGFVQAQQNADEAAKSLLDTLDKQTGRFTAASAQDVIGRILKDISPEDVARLKALGVNVSDATVALGQGSQATATYVAHLQELLRAEHNGGQAAGERRAALRGLIATIQNETETADSATNSWRMNAEVQRLAADAARGLGAAVDEAAAAAVRQAQAARDSSAAQTIFQLGMDSIANAAANVQARIDAIPSNVRISASAVGLDTIKKQADAAFLSVIHLLSLSDKANNIRTSGERHGADVSSASGTAVGQAANQLSAALARADQLYNQALASIRSHNAGIKTKTGGGSRGSSANPIAAARAALLEQVTDSSFIADLMAADAKGIGKIGASLAKGAAAALTGGRETALTRLIRQDTASLQVLATRRAAVAKRLQDAQNSLEGLQSQKAQTISSLSQAALGDLTGARSSSGVLRVLNRQLQKVTAFRSNLATLAKRGLPKAFLQQLVAAGLDGAMTAAALVRSNDADFAAISSLTTQLSSQASGLGTDAGNLLYNDGIAAAQGLIKGLQSQEKAVEAAMLRIAKAMQAAIRSALGIHSPSQVFRDLGRQIPAGMVLGIEDRTPQVHRKLATMVPTGSGYQMTAPAARFGGIQGDVIVNGAEDPVATARSVSAELMWRNSR